jgi:hypothetical protein
MCYLASFLTAYNVGLRKRLITPGDKPAIMPSALMYPAAIVLAASISLETALKITGVIRPATDYADSYLAIASLPGPIAQLLKITTATSNFAVGIVLVGATQNLRRYWLWIALYLVYLVFSYDIAGHRSQLATGLFKVALCWHAIVSPFKSRTIFLGGAIALAAFNLLGFYRGLLENAENQMGLGVSEFLMVYANALETLQLTQDGAVTIPLSVRFGEFFSFLPSQLVGQEKTSLDTWFAMTFHRTYYESGGGLAFGALPQAIIGLGAIEAIIRGALLGALFSWFSNKRRSLQAKWWAYPVQLFFLAYMYYSIRSSTFAFVGSIFQVLLPSILFFTCIRNINPTRRKPISNEEHPDVEPSTARTH